MSLQISKYASADPIPNSEGEKAVQPASPGDSFSVEPHDAEKKLGHKITGWMDLLSMRGCS